MLFEEEQFMSEQLQNNIDEIVSDFIRRSGGKVPPKIPPRTPRPARGD